MMRDAAETRSRLLESARHEFARYGIAGARIDRIAAGAGSNKSLIYTYFGNKDRLFDRVIKSSVAEFYDAVRFDAHDLPGWAGVAFDFYDVHEEALRLVTWYQLERPANGPFDVIDRALDGNLVDIASAQGDGLITTEFTPLEVLTLVRSVALAWRREMLETFPADPADASHRRQVVVDAIVKLLAPPA